MRDDSLHQATKADVLDEDGEDVPHTGHWSWARVVQPCQSGFCTASRSCPRPRVGTRLGQDRPTALAGCVIWPEDADGSRKKAIYVGQDKPVADCPPS